MSLKVTFEPSLVEGVYRALVRVYPANEALMQTYLVVWRLESFGCWGCRAFFGETTKDSPPVEVDAYNTLVPQTEQCPGCGEWKKAEAVEIERIL